VSDSTHYRQVANIGIWLSQPYYLYCACVTFMTIVSILSNAWTEWRNLRDLAALAKSEGVIEKVTVTQDKKVQD
jgi:hypothetical protein